MGHPGGPDSGRAPAGRGGLEALQAGAITTALPFSVILLLMCVATYRTLRSEHRKRQAAELRTRRRELTGELEMNFDEHFGAQVDERINYALNQTTGVRWRRGQRSAQAEATRARSRPRDSGG